jgi:hypothetical protein
MRDQTLSRWQCALDGSVADALSTGPGRGNPLSKIAGRAVPAGSGSGPYPRPGTLYAVEVCWISGGAVTCRTFRVRAPDECRAARIGCGRARRALRGRRATRIEAVDVEPIARGDGHE